MAKLNGATWDKMGKDARKELLKKTGSFPGNVGKDWDELTDGAKARLTAAPNPVAAAEANTKPVKAEKKPAVVAKANQDIEHAKAVIAKKTAKKVETTIDDEVVKYARKQLGKKGDRMLFGRWPEDAPQYGGLCFIAIPATGEVVKCDCVDQQEATEYISRILQK